MFKVIQMTDCIFCKIVKGEIPCYKIYEDNDFLAFLDAFPLNKGHTLVIPKKHEHWVWDVENPGKYWEISTKIAKALRKAFNPERITSFVLGEQVPHAHIWLVPRYEDDGHGPNIDFSNKTKFTEEEYKEIAEKIKCNL